jgi:5-methylcytosine-specific restriction endonuclease McrA
MPLSRADEIVSIFWLARLDNIAICCTGCQRLKGAMDEKEYRRLLALLTEFDEMARRDITRRLKAGGAVIRCGVAKA